MERLYAKTFGDARSICATGVKKPALGGLGLRLVRLAGEMLVANPDHCLRRAAREQDRDVTASQRLGVDPLQQLLIGACVADGIRRPEDCLRIGSRASPWLQLRQLVSCDSAAR
jgi:hypothetical protein